MTDIPISKAVLAFNLDDEGLPIDVSVLRLFDRRDGDYMLTFGACASDWQNRQDGHLELLYELLWHLITEFSFSGDQLHNALIVIPEYRQRHCR